MKEESRKTESIVLRVDTQTKEQLQTLANKERRKMSDFIRICIEDVIKEKLNPTCVG